jgi:hypothetical protein
MSGFCEALSDRVRDGDGVGDQLSSSAAARALERTNTGSHERDSGGVGKPPIARIKSRPWLDRPSHRRSRPEACVRPREGVRLILRCLLPPATVATPHYPTHMKVPTDFSHDDGIRMAEMLSDPARPEGTLTFRECAGFLFVVTHAPELVSLSDWLPVIFGEEESNFEDLVEANEFLDLVKRLYNAVLVEPPAEGGMIPVGCVLHTDLLRNFEEGASAQEWSAGFWEGFDWLELVWEKALGEDPWSLLEPMLMPLLFFRSIAVARDIRADHDDPSLTLEDLAADFVHDLPLAAADFSRLCRAMWQKGLEDGEEEHST